MFDLLAADALAGVEALSRRPEIYRSKIGLVGISQGGWIAPLAASRSDAVKFVISISGPAVTVGEEIAYSRLAGADPGSEQGLSDEEITRRYAAFTGPHGYDPDPRLRALGVPSLWILGERDRSLPVRQSVERLERVKRETKSPLTVTLVPGADHGMRNTDTGAPVDVWRIIAGWLSERGMR
jgi:dienelactone hydrolase